MKKLFFVIVLILGLLLYFKSQKVEVNVASDELVLNSEESKDDNFPLKDAKKNKLINKSSGEVAQVNWDSLLDDKNEFNKTVKGILLKVGPSVVRDEAQLISHLKRHKEKSTRLILDIWADLEIEDDVSIRSQTIFLMTELENEVLSNELYSFVRGNADYKLVRADAHSIEQKESMQHVNNLVAALEGYVKLNKSNQEVVETLQKDILAQCDKGFLCFKTVRIFEELGYSEQEILKMLPEDFQSVHF